MFYPHTIKGKPFPRLDLISNPPIDPPSEDGFFMSRFNRLSAPDTNGVTILDDASLRLTDNFSFCAWVYAPNRTHQYISAKYNLGGEQSWIFRLSTLGELELIYSTNGTIDTTITATSLIVPLDTLTLVHFRMVAGTVFFGINADAEESIVASTFYSSNAAFSIGWLTFLSYSDIFDISQPILFNSISSAANFETIYNLGPIKYSLIDTDITDDAVLALEMSSDDRTLTDLSGNNNDGSFPLGAWIDGQLITWTIPS